jgi:hypothetical protein
MSQQQSPETTSPDDDEIRVLIREAVNEIQRDHLKRELLKEIRKEQRKFSFGKVAGHPAFLLFVGFILTGVIGTLVTSRWQKREWDRQQARLIQIRRIEQKEKIMEALTQAIADSNATEEDVLIAFRPDWRTIDPRREEITKERIEAWRAQGGRTWRITKELLWNKLNFYFKDKASSQLLKTFDVVTDRREGIASSIGGLVAKYERDKNVRTDEAFQKKIKEIFVKLYENRDDQRRLTNLILEDIQKDTELPPTLWEYLN